MKIILVHKEPIIERIPSLKTLISYLADNNSDITIITSKSELYLPPQFDSSHVHIISVIEKNKSYGMPTLIKLFIKFIWIFLKNLISQDKIKIIFAGNGALIMAGLMSRFGLKHYVAFIVEYPNFISDIPLKENLFDKLVRSGIVGSSFYITFDNLHGKIINSHLNIDHSYCTLPGSTLGSSYFESKNFLHKRLNLKLTDKILLHSGGFGEWFQSKELAKYSSELPSEIKLVFHVSHNIKNDEYYVNYTKARSHDDCSIFSLEPVMLSGLDELVSSAYIGVAWYDLKVLGFKASMLGLAAGKIGNYLKCGIPVIVPNFESFSYIAKNKCGILIEDLSQLSQAVNMIDADYDEFSRNARKCYEELWEPTKYLSHIKSQIESI